MTNPRSILGLSKEVRRRIKFAEPSSKPLRRYAGLDWKHHRLAAEPLCMVQKNVAPSLVITHWPRGFRISARELDHPFRVLEGHLVGHSYLVASVRGNSHRIFMDRHILQNEVVEKPEGFLAAKRPTMTLHIAKNLGIFEFDQ